VALPSLKLDDVHDGVEDFTDEQRASLRHWEGFFKSK